MAQRFFEGALHASVYAKFRPVPPQQLGDRITSYLREKYTGPLDLCVDVGCGNGQCTSLFASKFTKFIGTDISAAQIDVAKGSEFPSNVEFLVSPAEMIPADSDSVQLVNSSQACHWFDLPVFFKEVDRVLCRNGIVALSGYTFPYFVHSSKADELMKHLIQFYEVRTSGYWGAGREDVDNEYANITIPYPDMIREALWTDETPITLAQFVSYLETWSGYQLFCKKNGDEAGQEIINEFITGCKKTLESELSSEELQLVVKRKYFLLVGRKP